MDWTWTLVCLAGLLYFCGWAMILVARRQTLPTGSDLTTRAWWSARRLGPQEHDEPRRVVHGGRCVCRKCVAGRGVWRES